MAKPERIQWKNHTINLVVISVGVTLAFFANQWWQQVAYEKQKRHYLAVIRQDLVRDAELIQSHLASLKTAGQHLQRLRDYSLNKKVPEDSLPAYWSGAGSAILFYPHSQTYQRLLATPAVVALLEPELASQLSQLHTRYEHLRELEDRARFHWQTHLLPRLVAGNTAARAFLKSSSTRVLLQINTDLNRQRAEEYRKAGNEVKTLLARMENN